MSTWSQIVVDLYREGYTPEEIQERIALPLVTLEYVNNVIEQRAVFHRKRSQFKRFQKTVPQEGTLTRAIYDKVQSVGGNEGLMQLLNKHSQQGLAKEWGLPNYVMYNYIRDFIRGGHMIGSYQGNYWSIPQMIERKAEIANKGKRKSKKLTIKDVRNLW